MGKQVKMNWKYMELMVCWCPNCKKSITNTYHRKFKSKQVRCPYCGKVSQIEILRAGEDCSKELVSSLFQLAKSVDIFGV